MAVSGVTLNGQARCRTSTRTIGSRFRFRFAQSGRASGRRRQVSRRAGERLATDSQNKYGEWSTFSENWPNRAREWLPMIDHPYDKATSEFIVTAPAKYQVVANGLLQETRDLGDGRRLTHWKQAVPIASWLNAIGIEQFDVHYAGRVKRVELYHVGRAPGSRCRPGLLRGARAAGAGVLQRNIGPYP